MAKSDNEEMLMASEFQALPLEYIISAPLKGVIEAQKIAAATTAEYIQSMISSGESGQPGTPTTVDFRATVNNNGDTGGTSEVDVSVPLLSIVPIPHIRIDSFTTNFSFQINQVSKSATESSRGGEIDLNIGAKIIPWVGGSIKGHLSSTSSKESTTNRAGSLEITVHASEAPMPDGLARVLTLLSNAITVTQQ